MDEDAYYAENGFYDEDMAGDGESEATFKESDFIPLEDLVYAPLYALAKSNRQLRAQIIEAIQSMGTLQQNGQEQMIQLNNINIAYDQVRPESEEGYSVDKLQMQVPLLSIVPITNLNVERAEIDFSTEVKTVQEQDGECAITARICSPEQRESDFLPRVSYRLKIRSLPATEGIMRLTDMLSSNQIAKKMDTTPVAVDGNLGSEEHKSTRQEINTIRAKMKKLKQLYQKISDMMTEMESIQQMDHGENVDQTRVFDKEKYLMAQADIANRIMEYQERIMDMELELGLERDYE